MKRFLPLFIGFLLLITISAYAGKKSYHYTYKAFATEGMDVEYTVQKDTAYYIGISIGALKFLLLFIKNDFFIFSLLLSKLLIPNFVKIYFINSFLP